MQTEPSALSRFYLNISQDSRVNVWHIGLYVCLLMLWEEGGYQQELKITRKLLMERAHFGSITTYHKCISKLTELGYIVYKPTYDSYSGTVIAINHPFKTEPADVHTP